MPLAAMVARSAKFERHEGRERLSSGCPVVLHPRLPENAAPSINAAYRSRDVQVVDESVTGDVEARQVSRDHLLPAQGRLREVDR